MITRLIIQLLFTGFMGGYIAYKEDHNIKSDQKPAPMLFWLTMGLMFPISFMRFMFIGALEKKK